MNEMSMDKLRGLILAVSSSVFIGSSFIIKKQGLKKAGASGPRASSFNFTVIIGEIANFAAYAYAPAILVTPLEALSIIFRYVLSSIFVSVYKLASFSMLLLLIFLKDSCLTFVFNTFGQVWHLATEPVLLVYFWVVLAMVAVIIFRYVPRYGQTHLVVYIGICSLMGSLTVIGVKAVGIALKLSFGGMNQFKYLETWIFTIIVIFCCLLQINYLNKILLLLGNLILMSGGNVVCQHDARVKNLIPLMRGEVSLRKENNREERFSRRGIQNLREH
ncbi:hypothetical protein J1N35_040255 [Gossypium stocksii]|uniref:Probable magnesium transporter n=1 Tax=Gossypium stocksii TaxID=47602 RepID=A0A9D3UDM7_9ROSI|nr:hypothetical protein J1N35_040255 [Gossypium stocksii]